MNNDFIYKYTLFLYKYKQYILSFISILILILSFSLKDIKFDTDWKIWYTQENLKNYENFISKYSYDDSLVIAFSDSNGILTQKAIRTIKRLTTKLENIKYISKVDSIVNYPYVYINKLDTEELIINNFIQNENNNSELSYKKQILIDDKTLINKLISKDLKSTIIVARLSSELLYIKDKSHFLTNELRNIIKEEKQYNNYKFHIHGGPIVTVEFEEIAIYDSVVFTPIVFLMMVILLFTIFKNKYSILMPFSIVILTILATLSIQILLGHKLNNFTSNIPVFIVAIALADSIHLYVSYINLSKNITNKFTIIHNMLKMNILPIFLTSMTTGIGFYSLMLSEIEPIQYLGESIAISVIIAFLLTIIVMPSWLFMVELSSNTKYTMLELNFTKLVDIIVNYHKHIIASLSVVFIIVLYGISFLKIDSNLIKYFDDDVEIKKSFLFIQKNITGAMTYEIDIDSKVNGGIKDPKFLKTVDKFIITLKEKFPDIKNVDSIIYTVKNMNKVFNENKTKFYNIPDNRNLISQYLLLYELSLPAGKDIQDIKDANERYSRLTFNINLRGTSEDLILFKWIKNWWNNTEYSIAMTGINSEFAKMQNSISKTLIYSLITTLFFVGFVLLIVLKSFKKLPIYLLPNILPIAISFGLMGWFNISIDLGIAISAAVILSIAIDDTIHYLIKFYKLKNNNTLKDSLHDTYKYAGSAMIFTTLVVALSFSISSFSSFTPSQDFGIITSLSLVFALVVDLLFLPSVLYFIYNEKNLKENLCIKK